MVFPAPTNRSYGSAQSDPESTKQDRRLQMAKQRIQLPKAKTRLGPDEARTRIDGDDVEGHGLPTTPPPSATARGIVARGTAHGGEYKSRVEDDDEGSGDGFRARGVKTR